MSLFNVNEDNYVNNYETQCRLLEGFEKDSEYSADLINSTNDLTENNKFLLNSLKNIPEERDDENLFSSNSEGDKNYYSEDKEQNIEEIDENTFITHNPMNNKNFDLEENNFKEPKENKNQGLTKKKQGRKRKTDDRSNIIHPNSAKDNVIYKLKVQSMKCIYDILLCKINKKSSKKIKLNKIVGYLLKEGKRDYNLDFFRKTIREILLLEKSKRHKSNKIPDNNITIKEYESEIIEILDMIYVDFIQDIFMKLSKEELEQRYGVSSDHLFQNIDLTEDQRKTMKDLTDMGIIEYYNNIKPRNRRNKKEEEK